IAPGLTINSGKVLQLAGPGGALMAYASMEFLHAVNLECLFTHLGEMTSLMNVSGPLRELPSLLVDDSLGLAMGWLYWLTYIMTYAGEHSIAGHIMRFNYNPNLRWKSSTVNVELWIFLSQITAIAVNFLPVWLYGNLEYCFGVIKIIGLSILIFVMFLINIGKGLCNCISGNNSICPNATGFLAEGFDPNRTVGSNDPETINGSIGTFASIWTVILLTFYAYIGLDLTAVTAGETEHQKEDIKKASRKTVTRIIILYLVGVFFITLNTPYDQETLLRLDQGVNGRGGSHSPFMIAIVRAGIPGLPHFANMLFAFAAWSAGTAFLYASSRTLHSLATEDRVWPQSLANKLKRVNRFGVPQNALIACSLVGVLGFMGTGKGGKPYNALGTLGSIASVSWLIVLAGVCVTYLRFKKTLKEHARIEGEDVHEFNRDSPLYPYRTIWQPPRAWFSLVACIIIILFNGWRAFLSYRGTLDKAHGREFAGSYLAPILFVILYVGNKAYDRWYNDLGWGFTDTQFIPRVLFGAREQADALDENWKEWLWRQFVFWFT
ncbi:hypothetical protein K440DRAFT_548381, partial [Wilcoxina mikolae CBS 423.85]